jgi:import inner membrane translocase subunit TIM44
MFKSTEMSEVLTEIVKMDPSFDTNEFIKFVQTEIIPNVLESISRQELDVLKDWCTETAFNILSMPIVQTQNLKMKFQNKIFEIGNVDVSLPFILSIILSIDFSVERGRENQI